MVAAWIRAETGVGPAIASGSQTKRGICALLPIAPTKKQRATKPAKVSPRAYGAVTVAESATTCGRIALYLSVPNLEISANMPVRNAKSPMRLTMNAFLPANGGNTWS